MQDYVIINADNGQSYAVSEAPLWLIERALGTGFTADDVTAEAARERLNLEVEIRTFEGRL